MMRFIGALSLLAAAAAFIFFAYFDPGRLIVVGADTNRRGRSVEERIREAEARSQNVKGVYMTSSVANDPGAAATRLRNNIISLLEATELNAVVIDVKETEGGVIITDRLKSLIRELHGKDAWVIARQVVFKDSSQEKIRPEWYLKLKDGRIWRDYRGGSWLDPAAPEVWAYQLAVARAASDAGFDEIQFDYIRFPSDGDVASAIYPIYRPGQPKHPVLRAFFSYLHDRLKAHRPDLILSADLFGYAALYGSDLGIGQRLEDIGANFDYISLMVYPSHYYAGFQVAADPIRGLPALYYPYRSASIAEVAPNHPYEVVHRSVLIADDILAGRATTTRPNFALQNLGGQTSPNFTEGNLGGQAGRAASAATTTAPIVLKRAKLRPWLQDFDLGVDSSRGIRYDAAKVRAQIDAAEAAGASGWLLWNPANVYTKEALKPE